MLRVHIRFLLTAAVSVGSLFAEEFVGKVVAITDGDTLKVLRAGTEVRVRLHGIDAPESRQPFRRRAQQFVGDLAFGKTVTIIVRDHDRYWRLVVEVILPDGRSLNHELVRSGLAWWIGGTHPPTRRWSAWRMRRGVQGGACGQIAVLCRLGSGEWAQSPLPERWRDAGGREQVNRKIAVAESLLCLWCAGSTPVCSQVRPVDCTRGQAFALFISSSTRRIRAHVVNVERAV